jgi:hypothetical protein
MFGWFKKSTNAEAPAAAPNARGVQPSYVTDDSFVLGKSCAEVRNTYEARLALYFAVTSKRRFVLEVPRGASVDASLRTKVIENGGEVRETELTNFSVYVGHESKAGKEGDGWVLGNSDAWESFRAALPSQWLKDRLVVGAEFIGADITTLERELATLSIAQTNIDDENVKEALLRLICSAREEGGKVYVQ